MPEVNRFPNFVQNGQEVPTALSEIIYLSLAMQKLSNGQFFGDTTHTLHVDGITLTDTVYTMEKVDWHYHENPYLTFILQGKVAEVNKKEIHHCSPGTLLFHNWDESHHNFKPVGFTRGFHIEMTQDWLNEYDIDLDHFQGSLLVINPDVKIILHKIIKETKINDSTSAIAIQSLLFQALQGFSTQMNEHSSTKPAWVNKAKEILHDQWNEPISLASLAESLSIHPVHLSRTFSRYFRCNLGEYIRNIRIERSLTMLSDKTKSLTQISFACGFADQSHYARCFREMIKMSPLTYRKLLFA